MTLERVEEIFKEGIEYSGEGLDATYEGIKIIAKYTSKNKNVIMGAEQNIIFCGDVEDCLSNGMGEQDIRRLASLGWFLDEGDSGFTTFI